MADPSSFADLVSEARSMLDSFVASQLPESDLAEATQRFRDLTTLLDRHRLSDAELLRARRPNAPGRGKLLTPPYRWDEMTETRLTGRVRFPMHFLGDGAAHGGSITLLFDEILGRVTNQGTGPIARTAWLKVSYRQIAPIGVELGIEAWIESHIGRKKLAGGRLTHGNDVVAEAEGLFIELRPGQA